MLIVCYFLLFQYFFSETFQLFVSSFSSHDFSSQIYVWFKSFPFRFFGINFYITCSLPLLSADHYTLRTSVQYMSRPKIIQLDLNRKIISSSLSEQITLEIPCLKNSGNAWSLKLSNNPDLVFMSHGLTLWSVPKGFIKKTHFSLFL